MARATTTARVREAVLSERRVLCMARELRQNE